MRLWFLPFVREGIAPASSAGARTQTQVSLRLSAPGRASRDVTRRVDLLGPGDVLAIEPRQVLRSSPSPASRDAEPEFFPLVEFDAPDLPWAYSPALPESRRLLPWIALVVVELQPGVTVDPGQQGQSPWILHLPAEVAAAELPDLSDAWAWAHAQVACATADQIAATLGAQPDRTLGRLLSPRRLLPNRQYVACVVPTFLAGRVAGLGGDPKTDPSIHTGTEPAWAAGNIPTALPVYHTWKFRTGDAGDFESLAQRLRPTPLDAAIPAPPLTLAIPGQPATAAPPVVDWEPPLRVPGSTTSRPRRPSSAVAQIRDALKGGTATLPVFGPSYFGSSWLDDRRLDPLTAWAPELNLTPMWRAAAGLGAEAVRGEQDALVAAASEQLETQQRAQRDGRRRQAAQTVLTRVNLRLAGAPLAERARVMAPILARAQSGAANVGMYTVAGRQVARKAWTARPIVSTSVTGPVGPAAPTIPAIVYRAAITRAPVTMSLAAAPPPDPTSIPDGTFSPRFARPMSEPLAARYPELMLPGLGAIPNDGVLLVESHPPFVEAFLAGANQELNYELLWRGFPADRKATAFRRFWGHDGTSAEDIDALTTWDAATAVGSHVHTTAAMILLVRGELVRRYPSVMISAVPAVWNADNSRSPSADASTMVLPAFRGRIGEDVLYAGFPRPSLLDAVGTPTRAGAAGWFVLLTENPGDPRFGVDPEGGTTPPTRATLSWAQLHLGTNKNYATLPSFPNVPDAQFSASTATAATLASLVRQRPFRAFLHASLLVRPRS